ncbi:hypothetical protein E2C01_070548 [Portunus trituberculatus]|uniref:Uncharacterized protein n=1 Tax=Portunus trituberculatus TaxID=210409 RepID=A0A5B7I1L6_PORTR|nr:hypothetical protein [Portunus trituberculatus]
MSIKWSIGTQISSAMMCFHIHFGDYLVILYSVRIVKTVAINLLTSTDLS